MLSSNPGWSVSSSLLSFPSGRLEDLCCPEELCLSLPCLLAPRGRFLSEFFVAVLLREDFKGNTFGRWFGTLRPLQPEAVEPEEDSLKRDGKPRSDRPLLSHRNPGEPGPPLCEECR